MNGIILEHVDVFKDLGVFIDQNLSFTSHIDSTVSKCNWICGMIKRSVGFYAPVNVKSALFSSLCRSHLNFASSVWSPH
ncbi:hypothetical protein CAPTEDRAFT_134085 [Capitella teleta]|uniref:Uncharacterized protein n=1 Tax=Capitella teleta TaxID=283909 RepID=R7TH09_CAPTE|nr:hypothetical protein CAPTEDRAFT_134085 [Capitella teleta]|eukprot:ELT90846.1 hypothetical protein CAPTEDRAFT_134085 [Capitella teleta]